MRSKPDFNLNPSQGQDNGPGCAGCLGMLVVAIGGYFVYTAVDRVLAGDGNMLDHVLCYGVLAGLGIIIILACVEESRKLSRLKEAHLAWKRKCTSAEVAIVSHNFYPGGSWEDEYGIPHSSHASYGLNLELSPDQRAKFPNLQSVNVTLTANIYAKLADRTVAHIYYPPESPMTFLLEEELTEL